MSDFLSRKLFILSLRSIPGSVAALMTVGALGALSAGSSGAESVLVESSTRSATGRRIDLAFDPSVDFSAWRTFAIVTPPPDRIEGIDARDRDRVLRSAIGVAFAIAGFTYADASADDAVDFVVEYRFDHPGTPPPGTTTWVRGRKTNVLEIRLRSPDQLDLAWRGRIYNVLRKKRNQRQEDEDAQLRFHAAAEAIIDAFRTSRGESP